jgi:uncharacterized protein HemX
MTLPHAFELFLLLSEFGHAAIGTACRVSFFSATIHPTVPDTASSSVSQVSEFAAPAGETRAPGAASSRNSQTGEGMKKLFGSLLLVMFLAVSGAAFAQDSASQDTAKQDTKKEDAAKTKKSKKMKKEKKEKKDETKKDDKKPS